MKKVLKLFSVLVMVLALTGCMKVRYQITIKDDKNADVVLTMLYSKEMMDSYNMSQDDIKQQLESEGQIKDWNLKEASETVDNEKYVGFTATAPKDVSDEILKGLSVKGNKYTLKLEGEELGESFDTAELGYSVEQLEKMGLEMSIKIAMPGKVKSSTVGKIENGIVNVGLTDLENMSSDITIVSVESGSSGSGNMGLIIGGVAAVIVVAAGAFYFIKKKNKKEETEIEEN